MLKSCDVTQICCCKPYKIETKLVYNSNRTCVQPILIVTISSDLERPLILISHAHTASRGMSASAELLVRVTCVMDATNLLTRTLSTCMIRGWRRIDSLRHAFIMRTRYTLQPHCIWFTLRLVERPHALTEKNALCSLFPVDMKRCGA